MHCLSSSAFCISYNALPKIEPKIEDSRTKNFMLSSSKSTFSPKTSRFAHVMAWNPQDQGHFCIFLHSHALGVDSHIACPLEITFLLKRLFLESFGAHFGSKKGHFGVSIHIYVNDEHNFAYQEQKCLIT